MNEHSDVVYPTEDEIIRLNKEILEKVVVRKADRHKLLSRAQITMAISGAKEHPGDLYYKAAILLYGLLRSHPFDSGNRRTGMAAVFSFLTTNGQNPKIIEDSSILLGIRHNYYSLEEIKSWLQGNAIKAFRRS